MFVFIVPLKSEKVSADWAAFSKLVERTLKSISNQTSSNYRIIIAGHEKPITSYKNDKIEFLNVNFEPPSLVGLDEEEARQAKEGDKAKKILAGIAYAKKYNPEYFMVVDSDDCINRNIVSFVENDKKNGAGWYFSKGYYYQEGKSFAFLNKGNFNKFCGSCIIIKASLIEHLFLEKPFLYYDHFTMTLKDETALEKLPFAGAMYSVGNGENHLMSVQKAVAITKSAHRIWPSLKSKLKKYRLKFITRKFKKDFGFYYIK